MYILCTQFSNELSWFGMFIDFPSHFHEFVHSTNSIFFFLQIWMFCTSNVHNFPLNFHDFVLLNNSNFSTTPDYLYIWCTQFSIEYSRFGTFISFPSNFLEFVHLTNSIFFYKSEWSIRLMYKIFHWIFTILYIQRIQIFKQIHMICSSNVYNFSFNFHDLIHSSIFHWDFTILYI